MGEGTLGPAEVPKMGTVPIAECPTIPECATEEELRALNQASHEKDLCTRCNVNLIGGPARTDSRSVRTKYNQRIASSMLDDALVTNCTAVLNRCSTALRGAEEPCLSDTRKRMLNDLATELHGANAQIQERLVGKHTRGRDEAGSVVDFLHESVAVSSWRGNSEREMNRWHAVWTPTDDPVPDVTSDDPVPDVATDDPVPDVILLTIQFPTLLGPFLARSLTFPTRPNRGWKRLWSHTRVERFILTRGRRSACTIMR